MKGMKYLLEATHYLPATSKIHILLLGNGMDQPRFKRLIEASPIKNQIINLGFRKDVLRVVKASHVFALASIYAKVTRDNIMQEYHNQYPQYGFDQHKGYGTAHHIQAIKEHTLSDIHRVSFCKSII
jgi:ribonuclease HII